MQMNKGTVLAVLKKYQYVLLILLVGVLLLGWPTGEKAQQSTESSNSDEEVIFDLPGFETEMAEVLSQIEGVGKADVVLTLSSGGRKVLAEDETVEENRRESTTVIISRGSSQQSAVTVEVVYPTFQGALVVCDGGRSPTVCLAVVQAVKALTGLQADEISVCARSGGSES